MLFNLSDGKMTGLEMIVLVSSENADKLIREFKKYWAGCGDPDAMLSELAFRMDINDGNLLPHDKTRVEKEVREYINGDLY